MKIIVPVISVLLLVAIPIYSQQNCEMEPNKTSYFVYNTNVEVKTYYCSYTDEEDSQCKQYNNGKLLTNKPLAIANNCNDGWFSKIKNFFTWNRLKVNFCELSARTSLLENIVQFSDNMVCLYKNGKCYNNNIPKEVLWTVSDICQNIVLIENGNYNVWTNIEDQTKFISHNITSLILTDRFDLCGFDIWTTNFQNIIVSKNATSAKGRCIKCPELKSNLKEFCGDSENVTKKQTSTSIPKTWYIYKYATEVTIHMCLTNLTNTCEDMKLESDSKNNTDQCVANFCNASSNCNYKSKTTICQATMQVDLEKNLVRDLPAECKYSDGLCESLQTFWLHPDRCSTIQKAHEGHEAQCGATKCVTDKYNSTKLSLLREGTLCGNTVWYTDQDGLVASETELQFSISITDEDVDVLVSQQSEDISGLQTTLLYVKLLVLFCVLWYVFNVIVNFISLRKLNKTRDCKKKVSLINCVSQGLTTHYLCLSHEEKKKLVVYDVKASQLYASVDNELYNMNS